MINWRNGKGGFVGGLKYIIKGVFQFAHSVTSVGPTPDCYIAGISTIIESTMSDVAGIGTLTDTIAGVGALDIADISGVGTLTDTTAGQGDICND